MFVAKAGKKLYNCFIYTRYEKGATYFATKNILTPTINSLQLTYLRYLRWYQLYQTSQFKSWSFDLQTPYKSLVKSASNHNGLIYFGLLILELQRQMICSFIRIFACYLFTVKHISSLI